MLEGNGDKKYSCIFLDSFDSKGNPKNIEIFNRVKAIGKSCGFDVRFASVRRGVLDEELIGQILRVDAAIICLYGSESNISPNVMCSSSAPLGESASLAGIGI